MAIIKYKDKDGNLVPLGASGDHTHSPESIGAAKKDHIHNVATEEADGFMSSADKSVIAELHDAVFGNDNQEGLKDLVGEGTVADRIAAAIADKVVQDGSKVLSTNDYTNEEKDKLKNIDEGANKYEHPAYTERSSGLYKITIDGTGHVSDVVTVVKKDITDLGIPTEDTTYNNATQSVPGLMSVDDKKKLDGIDPGATKVTVDDTLSSSSTNPVQNKAVQTAIKDLNDLVGETPVADRIESAISDHNHDGTYAPNKIMTGASSSANGVSGLVPQPTKGNQSKFLRADGTWQTPYTHPTTAGNKHIPSGGASGQFLKWSADGTATWETPTDTTYSAGTGIGISGTTISNSGVRSVSTGDNNGTIKVNTGGTSTNVSVKGLGSAAYTDSTAYATSGHSHTASEIGAAAKGSTSGGDFDNVTIPGIYTMGGTPKNSPPDPASPGYYTLIVGNSTESGNWAQQIAIPEDTHNMYIRYKSSSNGWSAWKRFALSDEVGGSSVDVFSTSANGLVPKPSSATATQFLNANGEWSTPYSIQAQETSSKRFLVGTDDQSTNAYTSSNRNCYMENGRLYSGGSMVITADMMQSGTRTISSLSAGERSFSQHTFSTSYASTPYFLISSHVYGYDVSVEVAMISESGFTVSVLNNGSSTISDVSFSWLAIGTPAS